jgi:hypothetical protein
MSEQTEVIDKEYNAEKQLEIQNTVNNIVSELTKKLNDNLLGCFTNNERNQAMNENFKKFTTTDSKSPCSTYCTPDPSKDDGFCVLKHNIPDNIDSNAHPTNAQCMTGCITPNDKAKKDCDLINECCDPKIIDSPPLGLENKCSSKLDNHKFNKAVKSGKNIGEKWTKACEKYTYPCIQQDEQSNDDDSSVDTQALIEAGEKIDVSSGEEEDEQSNVDDSSSKEEDKNKLKKDCCSNDSWDLSISQSKFKKLVQENTTEADKCAAALNFKPQGGHHGRYINPWREACEKLPQQGGEESDSSSVDTQALIDAGNNIDSSSNDEEESI